MYARGNIWDQSPRGPSGPRKWQYKVVLINVQDLVSNKLESIEDTLDELGSEGWELVAIDSYTAFGPTSNSKLTRTWAYFKRPV